MSGFITIYNIDGEPVDEHLIHSLTQTLKFRGPDRQKVWVDENIGMGHALFKTTYEAEYENQPVTLDGNIWITCSARIDDRKNLINKLGMKKKINLDHTPDSELILHAYRKWGESCLKYLLGDFAFVIWDSHEKKIFCARDRFGMRQLYYAQKNNSFIACNSLNCMLKHPSITKKLNEKAIGGFLLLGDHQWLDKSITAFEDINTLKPAHYLIIKNSNYSLKKYWDIPSNIPLLNYKKEEDYVEHFQDIFQTAVSDRIRTSSVVIAMSGGMDSTTIAAMVKRLQSKQSFKAHAITGIYEHLISDDERYYANLVAEQLRIPIHFIRGDKFPFIKSKLITTSPMQNFSLDLWFEMRKQTLKYSRVTLAGYAGDSLLYCPPVKSMLNEINPFTSLVELMKAYHRYGKVPSLGFGIMKKIKQMASNTIDTQPLPYPTWIEPEFEKRASLRELWDEYNQLLTPSNGNTRYSQGYKILSQANWNMDDDLLYNTITLPETRDPFLDTRVLEFIYSLPPLPWLYNKHVLRTSMQSILPDEVIKRPKTLLGNMSHVYLQDVQNKWVDSWSAVPELSNYIKLNNIPRISGGSSGVVGSYINLRPLYLNEWMKKITQLND